MNENYVIPAHLLRVYDVKALSKKMAEADWYHEYSDDFNVFSKGRAAITQITDELLQIASTPEGKRLAGWLWDRFVPEYSLVKPEFLADIYFPDQSHEECRIAPDDEQTVNSLTGHQKELGQHNEDTGDTIQKELLPKKNRGNHKGLSL